MKLTKQNIFNAYKIIKKIIDVELDTLNITYESSMKAPNTYKAMLDYFNRNGHYLVYEGGNHGIMGIDYNIKFRALHDHMHRTYALSFSFNDEKMLSDITAHRFQLLAKYCFDASHFETYCIGRVIDAEIRGQIEHYEQCGDYVADQKAFIFDKLCA